MCSHILRTVLSNVRRACRTARTHTHFLKADTSKFGMEALGAGAGTSRLSQSKNELQQDVRYCAKTWLQGANCWTNVSESIPADLLDRSSLSNLKTDYWC